MPDTPAPPPTKHFKTMDGLRGLGAVLVMSHHYSGGFGWFEATGTSNFVVEMFFVLSGMVLAGAYGKRLANGLTWVHFFKIRLLRLYPTYLMAVLLAGACWLLGWQVLRGGEGMVFAKADILASLGLAVLLLPSPLLTAAFYPLIYPAWTLCHELWVNVAWSRLFGWLTPARTGAIVAVAAIGVLLDGASSGVIWSVRDLFGGVTRVTFAFGLGLLFHRMDKAWVPRLPSALIIGLAAFFLFVPLPLGPLGRAFNLLGALVLMPALVLLASVSKLPAAWEGRVYTFLSDGSYGAYLFHVPALYLAKAALKGSGWESSGLVGVALIGLVLVFAVLLEEHVTKPQRERLLASTGLDKLGRKAALLALLLCLGTAAHAAGSKGPKAAGLSPFYAKYFLVAGSGERALKDGHFLEAAFRRPESLALSPDEATLYVADAGNHALRAIALRDQHRVTTLCGNGEAGAVDGGPELARLDGPGQLQAASDGKSLYFLDQGGRTLRRFDIAGRQLSTLGKAQDEMRFSSLATLPSGPGLLVAQADLLLAWDGSAGHATLLAQDAALDCPEGRLVRVGAAVYFANPCDCGLYKVEAPEGGFPGEPGASGEAKLRASLVQVRGPVVNSDASGFCALSTPDGAGMILAWDPSLAAIVRYNTAGGPEVPLAMSDYQGTPLAGPTSDLVGINANSDRRLLLKGRVGMVTATDGKAYVAEPLSGRVLGADTQLFVEPGSDVNVIREAEKKPAGVKRLLVVGDSLIYFWRAYTPEKRYNAHFSFVRQLEQSLNMEAGLAGQGTRYEVQAFGRQLGYMTGGTTSLYLQMAETLKARQADEVVLVVDYMSFTKELFMFDFSPTDDDLATLPFDLDWHDMGAEQRYKRMGPLRRGLIDDVKAHPRDYEGWMEVGRDGQLHFLKKGRDLLALPRIQQFAQDLFAKALKKCRAVAAANGAELSVVLLPTRDLVEMGEGGGDDYFDHLNGAYLDKPLALAAAAQKVRSYCLTQPMRLVAMPYYPLIGMSDHHYSARGQGWLAAILARQMTGSLKAGVGGE